MLYHTFRSWGIYQCWVLLFVIHLHKLKIVTFCRIFLLLFCRENFDVFGGLCCPAQVCLGEIAKWMRWQIAPPTLSPKKLPSLIHSLSSAAKRWHFCHLIHVAANLSTFLNFLYLYRDASYTSKIKQIWNGKILFDNFYGIIFILLARV